jgi:ABC-type phosphate transport system substrate-binding protein
MKSSRLLTLLAFVIFPLVPCFAHHMAVVVNRDSNVAEVSSAHLAKIFLLEEKKWPNGKEIVLVLHRDSLGENLTLEHLSGMSGADLRAFISSHKSSFTLVDSDDDVLRFVQSTPGSMGLVDVRSINDQVHVLRVGGKLPMEDGYLPH